MRRKWQSRIGELLRQNCAYVFRPVDSQFYGGQARLDFLAMGQYGRFVMVEVKETPNRKHFTFKGVKLTALQKHALTDVSEGGGESYLVVGVKDTVYWYFWSAIHRFPDDQQIPFTLAAISMEWQGQKDWSTRRIVL